MPLKNSSVVTAMCVTGLGRAFDVPPSPLPHPQETKDATEAERSPSCEEQAKLVALSNPSQNLVCLSEQRWHHPVPDKLVIMATAELKAS